jgi:hypothetical protein
VENDFAPSGTRVEHLEQKLCKVNDTRTSLQSRAAQKIKLTGKHSMQVSAVKLEFESKVNNEMTSIIYS